MGCGCGKKRLPQKSANQQQDRAPVNGDSKKTPLQVRKERVNKIISIPGTKPK